MEWRRRGRVHSPGGFLGIDDVHDERVYKGFRARVRMVPGMP
jgi:hypothetical protein